MSNMDLVPPSNSFKFVLLLIFCFLIAVGFAGAFGVCIHRLWLHPLAKYPGPLLGRLTNLYGAYYAWRGEGHLHMLQCHENYGDIVRYAPNRLLINTPSGLKTIYSYSPDYRKSERYKVMIHRAPNTLTAIDKKIHGRKRRIVSQGLSDAALRSYEPTIIDHINKLCDLWAEKKDNVSSDLKHRRWTIPQNVAKWTNYLMFDIMSAVVFGEAFQLLEKEDNRFIPGAIEDSNVRTSVLIQATELLFRRLDRKLFRHAISGRNRLIRFVERLLQSRLSAKPLCRNDAFSFLLQARDSETGESLTPAELGAEATTLVVAGSDTSSTGLATILFYLSRNPETQARVAAEVRAAFPGNNPIHLGNDLVSCTFLAACIDECLRLIPPAATVLWRETLNPTVIDGHHLPAGIDVGVCTYALHHRRASFADPFAFRPERWLSENRTPAMQAAFAPFSIGPRSCVGKGLARIELSLATAMMLKRFEFEPAPGFEHFGGGNGKAGTLRGRRDEYQVYDHITCAKDGPILRFREREDWIGSTKENGNVEAVKDNVHGIEGKEHDS